MKKYYDNGELVTKDRMEDEKWYYSLYQPFLESLLKFHDRRDITINEVISNFKKYQFYHLRIISIKERNRILRWASFHVERHNNMPDYSKLEQKYNRKSFIRKQALDTLELIKGFTPEQRDNLSNGVKTAEELAGYILELTASLDLINED